MAYLEEHRRSNLPATPAMTELPPDWREHLSDAWFKQTYYVKVDSGGHAHGIFTDPGCRQPANAYLSAMIANVWFRPALEWGRPVPTVAQVVPRTLVQQL